MGAGLLMGRQRRFGQGDHLSRRHTAIAPELQPPNALKIEGALVRCAVLLYRGLQLGTQCIALLHSSQPIVDVDNFQ